MVSLILSHLCLKATALGDALLPWPLFAWYHCQERDLSAGRGSLVNPFSLRAYEKYVGRILLLRIWDLWIFENVGILHTLGAYLISVFSIICIWIIMKQFIMISRGPSRITSGWWHWFLFFSILYVCSTVQPNFRICWNDWPILGFRLICSVYIYIYIVYMTGISSNMQIQPQQVDHANPWYRYLNQWICLMVLKLICT